MRQAPFRMLSIICMLLLARVTYAEPFAIARLKYGGGGDWYSNPTSLPNLLEHLKDTTGINVATSPVVVEPESDELFEYPMIYATGHGNIRFEPREQDKLRHYLTNGGFFWVDDNYGMDETLRPELERLFPEKELVEVPFNHPIYQGVRDFPQGLPKIHRHDGGPPKGLGLFHEGRLVLFYTHNTDIGDGMESPSVHNNPPEKRRAALDMGANIVLFALTQR